MHTKNIMNWVPNPTNLVMAIIYHFDALYADTHHIHAKTYMTYIVVFFIDCVLGLRKSVEEELNYKVHRFFHGWIRK
jgi:hypothetical protein